MNALIFLLGILCLIYYAFVNIRFGYTTFSEFYLILGLILIIYYISSRKIKEYFLLNKLWNIMKIVFFIGMAVFILIEGAIIMYPKKNIDNSDYVVILGAGLRGDSITATLRDRLNATIDYVNKSNFDGKIVVSGGQGPGESITEAEAMKKYLISNGIKNDIIMEDKATNTFENFKFSKEKIKNITGNSIDNYKVKVITTDFHVLRSSILAKRNNYDNVTFYSSNTKWYLVPTLYAREFFAFFKSLIFDR
nr:YdcF family protein [Clostridium sp. Ade.TY]